MTSEDRRGSWLSATMVLVVVSIYVIVHWEAVFSELLPLIEVLLK